jgi:hypothetical protein
MQHVLSSRSRMDRVVSDIVFDFSVKPRLSSERGNAILVASSIYEACKYFALFQKTPFRGKCAVVTSYNPLARDVTKEEVGANTETDKQFIFNTYTELLKDVEPKPGMTKTETYEENAKRLFIKEPANMKLLVVVDKLLTGFDAPSCTYLYIDKSMQDHGLFPGHLPDQPARRRGQGFRVHRRLQGPLQTCGERDVGVHVRAGHEFRRRNTRCAYPGPVEEGQRAAGYSARSHHPAVRAR